MTRDRTADTWKIEVVPKGELGEARAADDDWTGKASAKERRRLQNKLHQRAWRRRKAQLQSNAADTDDHSKQSGPPAQNDLTSAFAAAAAAFLPTTYSSAQRSASSPSGGTQIPPTKDLVVLPPTSSSLTHHPTPLNIHDLLHTNLVAASTPAPCPPSTTPPRPRFIPPLLPYLDPSAPPSLAPYRLTITFPLSPDHHLITLIQYNVFRAMMTNFTLCNLISSLDLECRTALSLPLPHDPPSTPPPSFSPTPLQRATKHRFWIDSIPCPQLRDNLIRATTPALATGASNPGVPFDEDDFCDDICGGLYDGFDDCATRGLLVWGDPWLVESWEVTPGFAAKWGYLLRGCEQMILGTNRRREARGEERLVVEWE